MNEKNAYSIAVLGFNQTEKVVLRSIFGLSARRTPTFGLVKPGQPEPPDLYLVDADSAAAVEEFGNCPADRQHPAILIGAHNHGMEWPLLARPLQWTRLFKAFDLAIEDATPAGGAVTAGPVPAAHATELDIVLESTQEVVDSPPPSIEHGATQPLEETAAPETAAPRTDYDITQPTPIYTPPRVPVHFQQPHLRQPQQAPQPAIPQPDLPPPASRPVFPYVAVPAAVASAAPAVAASAAASAPGRSLPNPAAGSAPMQTLAPASPQIVHPASPFAAQARANQMAAAQVAAAQVAAAQVAAAQVAAAQVAAAQVAAARAPGAAPLPAGARTPRPADMGVLTSSTGFGGTLRVPTPPPGLAVQLDWALVVDDNATVREFMRSKLAPFRINVDFAASGEEAIGMTGKRQYTCVFLDVIMPGMDGYQVCKLIKQRKNVKKTAVVMLTSKGSPFDRIRGTMAGCDSYLTKPVDEDKLLETIVKYLPLN